MMYGANLRRAMCLKRITTTLSDPLALMSLKSADLVNSGFVSMAFARDADDLLDS